MNYLDDLRLVGITKLLGCLPLCTILRESVTIEQMINEAENRGMKTFLFCEENKVFDGALYVADIRSLSVSDIDSLYDIESLYIADVESLNIFLNQPKQRNILKDNNWPTEAKAYVNMVANCNAHNEKLFELIALTFKDKREEFQHRNAMNEVKVVIS